MFISFHLVSSWDIKTNEKWIFLLTAVFGLSARFYWTKGSFGRSNVTIEWHIPRDTEPGVYRIRYFGHYKKNLSNNRAAFIPFEGTSSAFEVTAL